MPKQVEDYKIVRNFNVDELSKQVMELANQGYTVKGAAINYNGKWYQTMVKYKPKEEYFQKNL